VTPLPYLSKITQKAMDDKPQSLGPPREAGHPEPG